jgi:hypothetical protein
MLSAIVAAAAAPTADLQSGGSASLAFNVTSLPSGRPHRHLLFKGRGGGGGGGGGKGRGGKGRGGRASQLVAGEPPLAPSKPGERICMPIPPDEPRTKQGQVLEGTSFGAALSAIASLPEVRLVLELGTWYGGGSTVNLGKGIRDSAAATLAKSLGASAAADNCVVQGSERCCHSLVVTVEVFEPAWEHARRYLRDLPVWCVKGSTVAAEEMLQVHEIPPRLRDQHFKLYYQRDLALMRRSTPQLRRFCAAHHFDLVLIDGNEYTGWAEFNRVRTECKPTYLALHDTQTLKTQKIEEYLNSNSGEYRIFLRKYATQTMRPACDLIGCKSENQFLPNSAGWSIYKRVDGADKPGAPADAAPTGGAGDAAPATAARQMVEEVAPSPAGKTSGDGRRMKALRRQAAKAAKVEETEKAAAGNDDGAAAASASSAASWSGWLQSKVKGGVAKWLSD